MRSDDNEVVISGNGLSHCGLIENLDPLSFLTGMITANDRGSY